MHENCKFEKPEHDCSCHLNPPCGACETCPSWWGFEERHGRPKPPRIREVAHVDYQRVYRVNTIWRLFNSWRVEADTGERLNFKTYKEATEWLKLHLSSSHSL